MKKSPKREKPEPTFMLKVALRPSVARDVITILAKFSNHKMELLQLGQHDQATRLLNVNLFRHEMEDQLRKVTK